MEGLIKVDKTGREKVQHGTSLFPIACYQSDLRRIPVDWHWHDEIEIAVIDEGSAIVNAGNEKYTIQKGEGFFFNHGVLHSIRKVDMSGCKFRSLVFHPRLVYGSIDSVFYQRYVVPVAENRGMDNIHLCSDVEWHKEVINAINQIWEMCNKAQAGYEFRVRALLSEMIFKLWERLPQTQNPGTKSVRDEDRIKMMLQFIHDNYAGEITMKKIADSAMVSESECLRCFRRTIGTTPIQYVKQYRIQTAAGLLVSTQEKVADIAIQCGFQDISYFTKSFREQKGCVPTEYRRMNLQ